jgi:hypothetical protein
MSTDYYLACKTCRECIHIAQDGLSGFTFYSGEPDCMRKLGEFLGGHNIGSEHQITLISEHYLDDDAEDRPYEEMRWTPRHMLPNAANSEEKK